MTGSAATASARLHDLFAEQAARSPKAVAVEDRDGALSYRELDRRANRLAHRLRALGVGPERLVAVCFPRSAEAIVTLLAVLKAGGAYLPLDPTYPRERLAFMFEDAAPQALVTSSELLERLPEGEADLLLLDQERTQIEAEPESAPQVEIHPANLAVVIYTSGSTGHPKGTALTHESMSSFIRAAGAVIAADGAPRMLQHTALSFDISAMEVFIPLATGGTLVVANRSEDRNESIAAALRDAGVTIAVFVPTHARILLEVGAFAECRGLREIWTGGEPLTAALAEGLAAATGAAVVNLYGPTEASVAQTWLPIEELPDDPAAVLPIGFPFENNHVAALGEDLTPAPPGVGGELHVSGMGVARGYLHRPALTAEKFVPDVFRPGERMYNTGDVVREVEDGGLEFIGRADSQVKLRGFRIELGEIEAAIRSFPGVRAAAVIKDGGPGAERLLAYPVFEPEAFQQDAQSEWVEEWQEIYEDAYGASENGAGGFDISGWNDSYTGEPLPAEEMREWVDHTVERLRELGASRVLEVGCGTGLLLEELAPEADRYVGLDLSETALEHLRARLAQRGLDDVTLLQGEASELNELVDEQFDLVVFNSVVQCFPSPDYLLKALRDAATTLAPGGAIFVGDVRSRPLARAFHMSVEEARTEGRGEPEALRKRTDERQRRDNELVLDPAFFYELGGQVPEVKSAVVRPKRATYRNEMTKFRFDATLFTEGADDAAPALETRLEWGSAGLDPEGVALLLGEERPERVLLADVPDARVADAVRRRREVDGEGAGDGGVAIEPEELRQQADAAGYEVDFLVRPEAEGDFDALFWRTGPPPTVAVSRCSRSALLGYMNAPAAMRIAEEQLPHLRTFLEERLPDYMVPARLVPLLELPLAPNGKVARRELPVPGLERPELQRALVEPRSEQERVMVEVWMEVLGLEEIGLEDDFVELGGDSLGAMRISRKLRERGVEISASQVLRQRTVAALLVEPAEERR